VYEVWECDARRGAPGYPDAVFNDGGGAYHSYAFCDTGSGQGLGVIFPYVTGNGTQGEWRFTAPAGTYIHGVIMAARGVAANGWVPDVSAIGTDGVVRPFPDQRWDGGPWAEATSGQIGAVSVRLVCVAPRCIGAYDPYVYAYPFRLFVTDVAAPVVTSFSGPLAEGGTVSGVQSATVAASDRGGGVRRVYLKVNGSVIGLVHGCDQIPGSPVARRLVPCPSSVSDELLVDTSAAPFVSGTNRVQACAEDFAPESDGVAPHVTCTATRTVNVARGGASAAQTSAAVGGTPLAPGLHEAPS
jgi:hypothetical protein